MFCTTQKYDFHSWSALTVIEKLAPGHRCRIVEDKCAILNTLEHEENIGSSCLFSQK